MTVELQDQAQERIGTRATFDEEYYELLLQPYRDIHCNWLTLSLGKKPRGEKLWFTMKWKGISINQSFWNLTELRSFVVEHFDDLKQVLGKSSFFLSSASSGFGWNSESIDDVTSRGDKFHFFMSHIMDLFHNIQDFRSVWYKASRYREKNAERIAWLLREKYTSDLKEPLKEEVEKDFHRRELPHKSKIYRIAAKVRNTQLLTAILKEDEISFHSLLEHTQNIDHIVEIINSLTEAWVEYFMQCIQYKTIEAVAPLMLALSPQSVSRFCNSIPARLSYDTCSNELRVLATSPLAQDHKIRLIETMRPEDLARLINETEFIMLCQFDGIIGKVEWLIISQGTNGILRILDDIPFLRDVLTQFNSVEDCNTFFSQVDRNVYRVCNTEERAILLGDYISKLGREVHLANDQDLSEFLIGRLEESNRRNHTAVAELESKIGDNDATIVELDGLRDKPLN